eukprot:CAMPEP_0114271294 /NCGR_PEP_ID=MMETSP0058-20121206/27767_1 /TAXON_ID=36894 /ORGANISM="Pyramimonas parkeae, CCMP726" /LENGTH=35 /DNA_ID= /DNA_START= /DNA_END= /DNA_ORIENTATION=
MADEVFVACRSRASSVSSPEMRSSTFSCTLRTACT